MGRKPQRDPNREVDNNDTCGRKPTISGPFRRIGRPVLAQKGGGTAGTFEAPTANWLIVQNAASMTYDGGTLTLENVTPQTIMFADRPQRLAGDISTARFVDDWGVGNNSLEADPPNASLSVLVGDEEQISVIELSNPRLDGTSLSYDVSVLEGTVPRIGKSATLFIDWWYGPRGGVCHYGPWGGARCHWGAEGPWGPPR